ncbi:hypothetical protein [Haloarcula sp. K1]|uniref:hypothetical protein n=1 Tax=Haloarcula sp. K1 TaxID=1622207 RepID=UPI0007BC412D|nr:hypothetical protein [Haloarcula sp. K1]KZX46195.1 hypothetical protein AV929_15595 [Haloarcula sp. K1]
MVDQHDSTHTDAADAEREAIAEDTDFTTGGEPPLVIDESEAANVVRKLRAEGTAEAIPEDQLLIHTPSGILFKSDKALAYFHKGWTSGET